MYYQLFIEDFSALGTKLKDLLAKSELKSCMQRAYYNNRLFTIDMQILAINNIIKEFLNKEQLEDWLSPYRDRLVHRETSVAIIMAGNIPLVGFHDLLSVLASGHKAVVKLSGKDSVLIPTIYEELFRISPFWRDRVVFTESIDNEVLNSCKKIIATGSDSTINMFSRYFKDKELILRGNRSSIGLIKGGESKMELDLLANDVFSYFGLGCRNITTLLIPNDFDVNELIESFSRYREVLIQSPEWMGSYIQRKALMKMQNLEYIDGGFYIMASFSTIPPPFGCINTVRYSSKRELDTFFHSNSNKIQAVGVATGSRGGVPFGELQEPALEDYADGVNTLDFLL